MGQYDDHTLGLAGAAVTCSRQGGDWMLIPPREDRFPMIFLPGLFIPVASLPFYLQPLSYLFPLTYGVDILQGAIRGANTLAYPLSLGLSSIFCIALFLASLRNVHRRWIL